MSDDPYEGVYARGIAVGHSDIKTDAINFRFKDEFFVVPGPRSSEIARYNGYWYEAKIDDLRKLEEIRNEREGDVVNGPRPCLTIDKINQYIAAVEKQRRFRGKTGG